ncbi:MAG: hypothetical protein ACYC7E_00585 [Armatimonadota bacterium]
MSQTPLSYYSSYTIDTKIDRAAVTNYGGLFPYLDLMLLTDLPGILQRACALAPATGWQPAEYIATLLALNLTGGDCVDDVAKLADDPGIALYLGQIRHALGLHKRRMARGGTGALPGDLKEARFKRLRFQFINVPARPVHHARHCVVRYFHAGALAVIQSIRAALRILQPT